MIAEKYLLEWREVFPWTKMHFVEQGLLISRAIVAICSDPYLAERLAWREYCRNMADKLKDADYRCGMDALLRPGVTFDPDEAWANVRANIVDRLMTDEDRAELNKKKA